MKRENNYRLGKQNSEFHGDDGQKGVGDGDQILDGFEMNGGDQMNESVSQIGNEVGYGYK